MIGRYYWPTSNGRKVSTLLERLGVPYVMKLMLMRWRMFMPGLNGLPGVKRSSSGLPLAQKKIPNHVR